MLPSATHPESTPFMLVRESSNPPSARDGRDGRDSAEEEDFDTQVDARKSVKPRRPPPRANVAVDDLPTVIVEESTQQAAPPARSSGRLTPSVVVDVDDEWQRRSNPTLVLDRATSMPPPRGRTARIVVAGIVVLGAACGAASALGLLDLHSVHAAIPHMPRAIASLIHR